MPEIENQIIEKSKRTISRSVAEGESATFDLLPLANACISKCVDQIIPPFVPPNDRLRRDDFLNSPRACV